MTLSCATRRAFGWVVITAATITSLGCDSAVERPAAEVGAPRLLSETGLYADAAAHVIAADVLPFEPQYPLWSDGAEKSRWARLPPGTSIDASRPDAWMFPVGTRFWKEFRFGRRVETRFMERTERGWVFATYVWDEDGRDATRAPDAGIRGVVAIGPGVRHDIPSTNDCRACHEARSTAVLGFDALQLSPDRDPLAPHAVGPATGSVDLSALVRRGLVRGLPSALTDRAPRIVARSPRERAALGYLHANCGGCHDSAGELASIGMSLRHDLVATRATDEPAIRTTLERPSQFTIAGESPGESRRIRAGDPRASAIVKRMQARDPIVQMPPLGTHVVDEDAVDLVASWIREDLGSAAAR